MAFISEKENLFSTPNTMKLKNPKRAAFSSLVKNQAKKGLNDMGKNIDRRCNDLEEIADKGFLGVEGSKEGFRSPKGLISGIIESITEIPTEDDYVYTSCRCLPDINEDSCWLPEELCLNKDDIDVFATKWRNDADMFDDDIITSSPVKINSSLYNDYVPTNIRNSDSYNDLLDESFELVPPDVSF